MKSQDYWQKRFQAVEAMGNKTAKDTIHAITPAFDQAQAQIEKEINAWYGRFAKNNQISLQEAKKLLNTKELKEFRWDVDEYIEYGRLNAMDQAWMKQLENASARFHISRLEALKIRTQNAAERAFGNELDQLDQMAARIYMDDYYHTAYEIQRGLGIGWDVAQIDQKKLDKIVSKPWTTDKMTFSDRIWKSKAQLVDSLHKEMTQMCVLGKAPDQAIKNIADRMNVSKGQAGRLVMTEAAYFGSAAQKDCFNDLDVEKFEVIATLDNKTSPACREMDGKVFDMKDFQIGVTAPPFHVWCRSCTAPWFEDNDDGERAARGEDGKTYMVPANMKYQDWKDHFVDKIKDPADWLKVATDDDILKANATYDEIKQFLTGKVGFDKVEPSFVKVDHELQVANANQLNKLEQRFGAIHKSTGNIHSTASGSAEAYVENMVVQPNKQSLSLSPTYYKNKDVHVSKLKSEVESGWGMPCRLIDDDLMIYNVTHEYGHILENTLIQEAMEKAGWDVAFPKKFVRTDRKTRDARLKWYLDIEKNTTKQIFNEIISIAKETDPDFKLSEHISQYGKTNHSEFFAEVFVNSQLGKPNALGDAMNEWLKRKGF